MAQRFRQWPEFGTSGRVYRRIDTQREDVDFKGRTIIVHTSSSPGRECSKERSAGQTFERLRRMAGIVRDDGHAISLGCMI